MNKNYTKLGPYIFVYANPPRLHCALCGAVDTVQLPISVEGFLAAAHDFRNRHYACRQHPTAPLPLDACQTT